MYIIREDTVFHEILDSVQTRFGRNRVCTESCFGSVPTLFWECTDRLQPKTGPVQTLNAFFQNFVPSKYRPCTVRFSTRLPHGYRVTESKKCLYRVSGNVHCRYIVGTLPVLLGIDPVWVGTRSYGVGYRAVSVSLHGHLGVLVTPYYPKCYADVSYFRSLIINQTIVSKPSLFKINLEG